MSWWVWALVAYLGLLFAVGLWAAAARTLEQRRSLAYAQPTRDEPEQIHVEVA